MKINQLKIYAIAMVALAIGLTSCGKDSDEEAPKITQVLINGAAPSDHVHIDAGTTLTIEVRMTDNEALNQLKIDLHANDDGHSHESGEEHDHDHGGAEGSWEALEIINLSGTSQTVTRTYEVPNDIRGEWHLGILAIDEEGNEAEEQYYELEVENEELPTIDVETINGNEPGDELHVDEGDVLDFVGTITDNNGLMHIHVEIYDEDDNEVWSTEYDAAGATSWDMSQIMVTIPSMPTEHGELKIHAEDNDGFESEWEMHLHAH